MRFLNIPLLLLIASSALFPYNRSYEKWLRSETDHFRIFYLNGLREQAEITASVAEEVYGSLTKFYDWTPKDKIDVIVYDEDQSNGWAAWPLNSIMVWVSEMDFPLRGTHHWIRDVTTHELAHVISMQAGQKTRYNITDIRLGYFDYFNENVQTNAFTAYSFDIFPNWLAEGIAQNESAKKGHDAWDAHRDMIMRMKALGGKLFPLSQMDFFTGRGIDYESGPYNQGFAMVRWIEKKYGQETLQRLVRECARAKNVTFPMAVKGTFGKPVKVLYDEWAADEKADYERQKRELGPLVEGKPLPGDSTVALGYRNTWPRFAHDDKKLYFLSNGADADGFRATLCAWDFSDTIKKEADRLKPLPAAATGFYGLSDSDRFVTYQRPNNDPVTDEPFTDAFTDSIPEDKLLDNLKRAVPSGLKLSRSLTYHDHIMQACVSHGGKKAVLVRKIVNRNVLALTDNRDIEGRRVLSRLTGPLLLAEWNRYGKNPEKVIYDPDSAGRDGFSIYTPRFSPNDSLIVFSYFDGSSRDIGVADTFGNFTPLLTSSADERDPDFTPDGKTIVFSSDHGGIFNLYRLELATGKTERITNVLGGAFCPAVSNDGRRIAYSNFDTAGFSIYITDNVPLGGPAPAFNPAPAAAPLAAAWDFSNSRKPYFPVFTRLLFSPMVVGEELTSSNAAAHEGKFGIKAGGVLSLMDPRWKNTLYLIGLMEVSRGVEFVGPDYGKHLFFNPAYDKEFMVLYENTSFYPTISLEADKFLIHEQDSFYNSIKEEYEGDNYLIDVQRYRASLYVPVFTDLRHLQAGITHNRQNADFYDLDPSFALEYTFFKEWNPYLMFTHLNQAGAKPGWRQEDAIDTRGWYFKLKHDWYFDEVLRDGSSWTESFEIGETGVLKPLFSSTEHRQLTLDVRHARPVPFLSLLTMGGEARASVADRPMDNFLYPGLFMKCFPFLADRAHLFFLGRNTLRAEGYVRFPILRRLRASFGPFLFDKVYGMAFVEAGLTSGIDPSEAGREDLDPFYRQGRGVDKYMARMETSWDSARTRVYFNTRQEMEDSIQSYLVSRPGYHFDSLDKHVIYERLPDDTVRGFLNNFETLLDAPARVGFGLELRMENYIAPGFPFFVQLRYSMAADREDWGGSFKRYFTDNPLDNPDAFIWFNIGFSFDNWELIDIPEYHHPRR